MTVNSRLQNAAIRHALLLEGFKAGEKKRVLKFLNEKLLPDVEATVFRRLNQISRRGLDRGPWKTKAYKDLLSSIDSLLGDGFRKIASDSQRSMKALSRSESKWQLASLDSNIPFDAALRVVDPAILRAVVTARPFQGKVLRDWWKNVDLHSRDIIKREISIGISSGESVPNIVRRLTGSTGRTFGGTFKTIQRNATTIVRTAVSHVSNASREATFKENSHVIKSVRYVATLDARTTDICGSLDGRTFDIDKGPRPPMHHQCRSAIVPVTKSIQQIVAESSGKTAKNIKSQTVGKRAEMNGQVPANQTYGVWLKGQPRSIQDFALGRGRANLFRRGNVDIRQFTDRNFKPLSLADLEKVEKRMLKAA